MNTSQSPSKKPIPLHYLLLTVAVGALLLLLCLGLLLLNWRQNQSRPLKPARPSPTPAALIISREPESVTFSQLNEDPFAYINQSIQVNGSPILLPLPNCTLYNGPTIRWALVGEELQLNGRGYERIMRQVAPDVTLTVKGIWRLYDGPLGCGKGPPSDILWYLEAIQIVAPNPLPLRDGTLLDITIQPADPLATLEPAPTPDPSQPDETTPAVNTMTPTATPTLITGTPGTPTPTATDDPDRTNTPTPTRGTTTPTATMIPGVTNTPTLSPSPTSPGDPPPPPPPLATPTPGGYAPPPPTPGPTPYG